MKVSKLLLNIGVVPVAALLAAACVNEEYDLNKGVDLTIGVNGEISAPIGTTENILIGDFLSLEDGSMIKEDAATGDYLILVEAETPITESVTLERITIAKEDLAVEGGFRVRFNMRDLVMGSFLETGSTEITDKTLVDNIALRNVQLLDEGFDTNSIDVDQDVSEIADIVKAVGTIHMDAPVELRFTLTEGQITVKQGLKFTYPSCVTIELLDRMDYCEIQDGSVLVFTQDFPVSSTEDFVVNMKVTEIDVQELQEQYPEQGYLGSKVFIDQEIVMSELFMDTEAGTFARTYGELPLTSTLDVLMTPLSATVLGATAVIDPNLDIVDQTVSIGEDIPDFLRSEDIVLDIYNPVISFEVYNSAPVSVLLSAQLDGLGQDGSSVLGSPILLGSTDAKSQDAILLSQGTNKLYLSARGVDVSNEAGARSIVVERLPELLKTLPYDIKLTDIDVTIPIEGNETDGFLPSDFISLSYPADDPTAPIIFDFSVDYRVEVPLAFGPDLYFRYEYDITGLNGTFNSEEEGGLKITMNEGLVKLTFVNAIPLNIAVTASPIDTDRNVITDPNLKVELTARDGTPAVIQAGSLESETLCPALITVTADVESLKKLDGFRLNLVATSHQDYLGVALNSNQYVRIEDMSVTINGGVEMQLDK